jgi:hypothetical protein
MELLEIIAVLFSDLAISRRIGFYQLAAAVWLSRRTNSQAFEAVFGDVVGRYQGIAIVMGK